MEQVGSRTWAALGALAAGAIALALYWLTLHESQLDPCATPQNDVSAAILADDRDDGDGLANRAIIQRGNCPPPTQEPDEP